MASSITTIISYHRDLTVARESDATGDWLAIGADGRVFVRMLIPDAGAEEIDVIVAAFNAVKGGAAREVRGADRASSED